MDSARAKQLATKYPTVSFEIRPIEEAGYDALGFAIYAAGPGHACDLARLMVEAGEPDLVSGLVGKLGVVIEGWDSTALTLDTRRDHRFKIGYRLPTP